MSRRVSVCPVCHRRVNPTARGNIIGHFDKAMEVCPGSGHPWEITLRSAS